MSRPSSLRQEPFGYADSRNRRVVGEDVPGIGISVWSSPGCVLFIEAMCHGDYQQVPVDPEQVDELIETPTGARQLMARRNSLGERCPKCGFWHDGGCAKPETLRDLALEFYADKRNYAWEVAYGGGENAEPGEGVGSRWTANCPVAEDFGARARKALNSE